MAPSRSLLFHLLVGYSVAQQMLLDRQAIWADDGDISTAGQCGIEMLQLHATGKSLNRADIQSPPVAKRRPHQVVFGKVEGENRGPNPMEPARHLVDDYFWLRDDSREDKEVLRLLRQENAYTQARTEHLEPLHDTIYKELLSHLKKQTSSYPTPARDGYEYWYHHPTGFAFGQYMRRPQDGSTEGKIILDENEVCNSSFFLHTPGWNTVQCDVSGVETSPKGNLLAYSVDGSGKEMYNIRFRDLMKGTELQEQLNATANQISWVDNSMILYLKHDEAHRTYQVWRHVIGSDQMSDKVVYEEPDELFSVSIFDSRDRSLIFIWLESHDTTEVRFIQTRNPKGPAELIRARQKGVQYDVSSHAASRSLFIVSNINHKHNKELLVASLDSSSTWSPVMADGTRVLAHSTSRSLNSVTAFANFLVVAGRQAGYTQLWIVPLSGRGVTASGRAHRVDFDEEAFTASLAPNMLFDPKGKLRISYSSMVRPPVLLEYDIFSHKFQTLKVESVPNYTASLYKTMRTEAAARDGVAIPVTLLWRPDAVGDAMNPGRGGAPCHLYGYGSYGMSIDPSFSAERLPLVDRGIVYAIVHVRGGGEMGYHAWYKASGKYLKKQNTFNDFVDVAHSLLQRGIAKRGALSCEGHSAGGLLIGNVVNMAPQLFVAALAVVPFVDLMVTMSDPSIPLTTEEWEEWGNPNEAKYFKYMMSYSPINNVRSGSKYPSMLIVSALNDPRVGYWEPAKWAQVLRSRIANGDDVLLKMDLSGGHAGVADPNLWNQDQAFRYAWLLSKLIRQV